MAKTNVGDQFGELRIIKLSGTRPASRQRVLCSCSCGKKITALLFSLVSRHTKSCGHLRSENRIHGMSQTPEYRIWKNLRQRCYNPKNPDYKYYGGRGITVCKRWSNFQNFYEDRGPRPSSKHSIDRIDTNGNYTPTNTRWATAKEQSVNRRDFVRPKGETHKRSKLREQDILTIFKLRSLGWTQIRIARKFSVSQQTIYRILNRHTWTHIEV